MDDFTKGEDDEEESDNELKPRLSLHAFDALPLVLVQSDQSVEPLLAVIIKLHSISYVRLTHSQLFFKFDY